MSNREIGKALLNVDPTSTLTTKNAHEIALQVRQRDRWRIRILASLSTLFTVLTIVGIVFLITFYFMLVVPRLDAYAAGRVQLQDDWKDWILAFNVCAEILLACLVGFLFASICLVQLVFASRNALLREIRAELAEISGELKELRPTQYR
jgi:uncharacterized membrane protein YjgN (DUF898 family)